MKSLSEIEKDAAELSPPQKQELMLLLAARLRADGARMPEPRKFTREQIDRWIAEDESELRQFNAGK